MTRSMLGQVGRYAALPAKRGQIARSLHAGPCLPGGLLRSIRSQRGLGMMLAADAVLFGWCLLASLALDFAPGLPALWHGLLGAAACALAFGLCWEVPWRMTLKTGYILLNLFSGGMWTAAVVFLILFEHVAVVPAEGEDDEGSVARKRAV